MNELLQAVYDCDFCKNLGFGFTRPTGRKGFYKFPPTIGSEGEAPLLFIGLNPRKTTDNERLHERLMGDMEAFTALSRNMVDGQRYIMPASEEGHYNSHMRIVSGVFGESAKFEQRAVVTELYLCASANASQLGRMKSPCANTYLDAVLAQVKPSLIICVGKTVAAYLRWKFAVEGEDGFAVKLDGRPVQVVRIIHPNDSDASEAEKERLLSAAIKMGSQTGRDR